MNPQDELLDTIDNYLNNGMSEEQRFVFEEKIAQDKTLSEKVEEVRATNEAIYYASLAELKASIGQDIKKIKYKTPFDWKKASYISIASLALLSGVTTYFVTNNTKNEASKSDSSHAIEVPEQKTIQKNNTSSISEKANNKNNTTQLSTNEELNNDRSHTGTTTSNESLLPSTTQNKNSEDTKNIPLVNTVTKNDVDLNTKKIETPIFKESKINCDKTFNIHTEPSCKQSETGSITIESDGANSYLFQVDNRSNSGSKGFFYNLSDGNHEILVTYSKECLYKKKVTVEEKWCSMNTPFSFNPDYHETWVMQYETGSSGRVIIYDRSGKEVYSSIFGGENDFWDGSDIHGGIAAVGIYVAIIKYSDGRQEKVELTIVR